MPIAFPADQEVLAPGIQQADVDDVEEVLVDNFTESSTRRPIFVEWVGLRAAIREIIDFRAQWLDGSYCTRKRDPRDIDVATFLDGVAIEALSEDDQATVNGLLGGSDTADFPLCDSFAIVDYPADHPMHAAATIMKDTFQSFYGRDSRLGIEKGFIEVTDASR